MAGPVGDGSRPEAPADERLVSLSETDLALVDAVQVNPRASWSVIGATLGISGVTAGRRWRTLAARGLVWTGSVMGPRLFRGGVLEVSCRPGTAEAVLSVLVEMPGVFTVARTTGDHDLYALTVAPSVAALARSLLDTAGRLDAARVSTHVYTRIYGGPHWRLGVLNRDQTAQVSDDALRPLRRVEVDAIDRRLFRSLGHDARRPFSELAAELDVAPQVVRRRMARLRRGGYLALRADLARPLAGWPVSALLWLTVPIAELDAVGRSLGGWAETRFAAATTSIANLLLIVNLRDPEDVHTVRLRLAREHPGADVLDQRLVLRMAKINGHVLDEAGRSVRVVPVDPWVGETGG